jgi:murein DD-endopeptidase MepM/ murein hydrolase activator NlpD
MSRRRFQVALVNPATGSTRQFSLALRTVGWGLATLMTVPVLVGMGVAWRTWAEVEALQATNLALQQENQSYRGATQELTGQIAALQTAVSDLGGKAAVEPSLQAAMERLPAIVKNRAMGGTTVATPGVSITTAFTSPESTFSVLEQLLAGLETRLRSVSTDLDRRNTLAAATPSIWPTQGWLSSTLGSRSDPLTGAPDYHPGLDISADRGAPVYATADGTVDMASYSGDYGNLVVIRHRFGIETRYGHLSAFRASKGQVVRRGELIGLVGATGRATGAHLHYEVRVNGRVLNPLQFLTRPPRSE